ncbi:hypothetical protein DES34_103443 [Brevibacillus brevis]|nr:hypothetical protein DES34_103443 [Brevibacillus brevis]VEF90796.1 Uncharacterised protein [Brevibacillus brevis]
MQGHSYFYYNQYTEKHVHIQAYEMIAKKWVEATLLQRRDQSWDVFSMR